MNFLVTESLEPTALLDAFARRAAGAGAIVSFTGVVRGDAGVSELWLDHHPRMTEQALAQIDKDVRLRFELEAVEMQHRVGFVATGEPIVFVVAAARHRRAAFDAVDYIMDRLKTDALFWKRELRESGGLWIEARDDDHRDRARWEVKR